MTETNFQKSNAQIIYYRNGQNTSEDRVFLAERVLRINVSPEQLSHARRLLNNTYSASSFNIGGESDQYHISEKGVYVEAVRECTDNRLPYELKLVSGSKDSLESLAKTLNLPTGNINLLFVS